VTSGVGQQRRSRSTAEIVVLHVGGDEAFAERLETELSAATTADLTLHHAGSAGAAEPLLADADPDCVVSGYALPDADGIDFLESVGTDHDVACVLLADDPDDAVAEASAEAGLDGCFSTADAGLFSRLGVAVERAVERVRTREALAESERVRRTLSTTLPGVVYSRGADADWTATYLSDGCRALTGHDPERFLSGELDWVADLVHPEDRERLREVTRDALACRDAYEETYRIHRSDGDLRYVREYGVGVFEGEELVALEGYLRDVTEERERRETLAARRDTVRDLHEAAVRIDRCETESEVYETLVETAYDMLSFDICCVNREDEGRLPIAALSDGTPPDGYSTMTTDEGLVGKAYTENRPIVAPDLSSFEEANPQGPYESALTVPLAQYGVFQAVSYERDAFDRDDLDLVQVLVDHCVTTLDSIERERTLRERERELRRQNERLEEFAGVLSHDLRNPLTVARGWTDLLDADPDKLARIEEAHERMTKIIDDVLALARESDPVSETEPTDLGAAAERAWGVVEMGDATLEVVDDAEIRTDPDRFGRLLENLFSNAAEHAGDDAAVTVGTCEGGFYVADDGPGVPEADREAVFDSGVTTDDDGTGFGLSIVETVAEAHGWTVDLVESEAGGARFEFDLDRTGESASGSIDDS